jgi:hypothetical protein
MVDCQWLFGGGGGGGRADDMGEGIVWNSTDINI